MDELEQRLQGLARKEEAWLVRVRRDLHRHPEPAWAEYRTAAQAIGYKEFFPYFEGTQSLAACTAALKQATRRYAKRQLTWFRHQNDARWLYVDEEDAFGRAAELIQDFLQN